MRKTALHTWQTARFRRFIRKGYSAFRSVGRCVTIGHLAKSEVDASLNKQKPGVFLIRKQEVLPEDKSSEEDVSTLSDLLRQLTSFLLPVTANDVCCCPHLAVLNLTDRYISRMNALPGIHPAFCISHHTIEQKKHA